MEISVHNLQQKVPIPGKKIIRTAKASIVFLTKHQRGRFKGPPFLTELSVVFVGTKRMRALNRKYLKHDDVTDVLSFHLDETTGEIIICPRVAASNARAHQTSTEKELVLYVVHGILHLAGYQDHSERDIQRMRMMENKMLSSLRGV